MLASYGILVLLQTVKVATPFVRRVLLNSLINHCHATSYFYDVRSSTFRTLLGVIMLST